MAAYTYGYGYYKLYIEVCLILRVYVNDSEQATIYGKLFPLGMMSH
jgi:hypothetical protein